MSAYDGRPEDTLNALDVRQMYERARRKSDSLARTPIVRMSETARTALADTLRSLLVDYVDPATDRVGHSFPMGGDQGSTVTALRSELYTHAQFSSIKRLSESLVRGAAVTGCEPVADLVANWVDGAPVSYRTCTVVPITVAQAVSPIVGVDVVPLALSTEELPAGLPARRGKSRADFLGQSLISIDAEMRPALFRPKTENPKGGAVGAALVPPVTLEDIREALSLECNAFVDAGLRWDDYGEFSALASHGIGPGGTVGYLPGEKRKTTRFDTGVSTIELSEGAIRDVSEENLARLLGELQRTNARTRLAVARWKMAMNRLRLVTDRFIDLRIALESLFLPQRPDQELKFRLAISGAWLLGEDAADRRRVWEILRTTYDVASTAIHGGNINKKLQNGSAETLSEALAVCHRGILRVLRDGPVKNWTDLILQNPDG